MSRKITQDGHTFVTRRVKAKTLLRVTYPGRSDCSVPLLYVDPDGVLQYGTAWDRADKQAVNSKGERIPAVILAARSQSSLGKARGNGDYDRTAAQQTGDADLLRLDPDEFVYVVLDPEEVALHRRAAFCPGHADGTERHLKIVKANPSRNAWCTGKGADYKAAGRAASAQSEDTPDTDDEAPRVTPGQLAASNLTAKAARYAAQHKVSMSAAIEALTRNARSA